MADDKLALEALERKVDQLTGRITELVHDLSDKERLEQRVERAEERVSDARHDELVASIDALTKAMVRPNIESLRNMGWAAEGNGPAPQPIALLPAHRKDDSLTIETDHDGDKVARVSFGVKLKRILPYAVAAGVAVLEALHAAGYVGHGH